MNNIKERIKKMKLNKLEKKQKKNVIFVLLFAIHHNIMAQLT